MSGRGGRRAGAGRPERHDKYDNAYRVWTYVQRRKAQGIPLKAAKVDAEKAFGMCRTDIVRQLEFVEKNFEVLSIIRHKDCDMFDKLVDRLHAQGWLTDDE